MILGGAAGYRTCKIECSNGKGVGDVVQFGGFGKCYHYSWGSWNDLCNEGLNSLPYMVTRPPDMLEEAMNCISVKWTAFSGRDCSDVTLERIQLVVARMLWRWTKTKRITFHLWLAVHISKDRIQLFILSVKGCHFRIVDLVFIQSTLILLKRLLWNLWL